MKSTPSVERPDEPSLSERPPDEELRAHLRGMWDAVAPAWSEHAAYADARGSGVGEQMLKLTTPVPGDRVLELACGPAGLGLAAASLVAPDGEVVLSDVSAEMTSIAATRANALGLSNVRTRQLDLVSIDEADGSYDVVLCREGLMFATDPARATREIRRVLRPNGRVAIAVWGPRELNPWLGLVFDAVGAQIGKPVPPPGIPGPFSLGNADRLERLLIDAALDDVIIGEQPTPLRAASFEEWWTRTSALAGPLTKILGSLPEDAKQAIRARLHETTTAYQTPRGMEFPGVSLIASARRR